jgi:hypothetical protein
MPKPELPPAEYVTRDSVFVLDPHQLRDKHGKVIVDVTEDMLNKIAQNQNARIKKTGDATPLVIGHTKDDGHEHEQPELVGYATDWRLEKFFKTGKRALACTFHVFSKAVDKVRKYPRRSVELWLDSLTIDPISLLGATTPERDLGLLKLSKDNTRSKLVATRDDTGELTVDPQTQQIVDAVLEAIKSTDVWQFMEKQMSEESGEQEGIAGAGDENPMAGAEGGEFNPEGDAGVLDALGGGEGEMDAGGVPGGEEEPLQMEAGGAAGMPGGGNTFAPGMIGADKKKYSRIDFSRVMRENEEMKQTLSGLVAKYRKAEREKALIQLESEGYMFDKGEELTLCEPLDDAQFKAHVQRVRARYQKAPVGSANFLEQSAVVNRGRSINDVKSIVDYATANGLSYEAASERLNGSSKSAY